MAIKLDNPSPHLRQQPNCLRCQDGASKYNHCSWCGESFAAFVRLREHWETTECGPAMRKWLKSQ